MASTSRARSSSVAGAAPIGRRHCPTGSPSTRSIALVGNGFGRPSLVSKSKALDQAGVELAGRRRGRPAGTRAIISPSSAPTQCEATPMTPTAPTDEQRQGQGVVAGVDTRSPPAPRRAGGPVRRGRRPRPSRPTMFGTSWARRSSVLGCDPCGRCGPGCRRGRPAGRSRRRRRGSGPRCPACDGRL